MFTIVSTPDVLSKINETTPTFTLKDLTLNRLSSIVDEDKISELDGEIPADLKDELSERISRKDDISLRLFEELAKSEGYVSWKECKRNFGEQPLVFFYFPRASNVEDKNRIMDYLDKEFHDNVDLLIGVFDQFCFVPVIHSKVPQNLCTTHREIFGMNSIMQVDLDSLDLQIDSFINLLTAKGIPKLPSLNKRQEDLQKKKSLSKLSEPQVSRRRSAGTPQNLNHLGASNEPRQKKGCSIS